MPLFAGIFPGIGTPASRSVKTMTLAGQAFAHSPQPAHNVSSTTAKIPFGTPIASLGHAFLQFPHPTHNVSSTTALLLDIKTAPFSILALTSASIEEWSFPDCDQLTYVLSFYTCNISKIAFFGFTPTEVFTACPSLNTIRVGIVMTL